MSSARADILARLRARQQTDGVDPGRWIASHARSTQPSITQGDAAALRVRFVERLREASGTLESIASEDEAPAAIARYLASQNLPSRLRVAAHLDLQELPWDSVPTLAVSIGGAATAADEVSVTRPLCGVAETGTAILVSGPDSPTTLSFLPDTNIMVLSVKRIVGGYEDAWDLVRSATGGGPPRSVNFITGPSRSADIEQTLQLGAHGPRRLHVVLVGRA